MAEVVTSGNRAETDVAVIEALRQQLPAPMEFDAATPLFEGGIELTSLRLLRVLMAIEEKLGLELDDDEIVDLDDATVGDLCRMVAAQADAPVSSDSNAG